MQGLGIRKAAVTRNLENIRRDRLQGLECPDAAEPHGVRPVEGSVVRAPQRPCGGRHARNRHWRTVCSYRGREEFAGS